MQSRSSLVPSVLASVLAACSFGMPEAQIETVTGTGEGGSSGSAGAAGSGGESNTGGASSSGGQISSGGAPGTGGGAGGNGDPTGAAGNTGNGGASDVGGTSVTSGGSSGRDGAVIEGGGAPGSGGRRGTGGVVGSGGRTGPGGNAGTGGGERGGTSGTGVVASAGGSTGSIALPPKFVGNIDTRGSIRSDFVNYWDQFSPENAGKWGSVQSSSQGSFNWNSLDAMYKYANEHNLVFKEHCFVWGAQQPGWTDSLTATTGPAAVQNWMKSFCQRYPNTKIIDVVNEPPPHTTPKYANAIGGGTNTTWDWIANAFKWAREACPNAVLVLNDYNNVELSGDAKHTIDIVTAIKKLGAPVDAVGCQTHGASNMASSTLKTNIDKIVSGTGLPVYITEYDINLADDAKQKERYQDHVTMFWNHPDIKGITVWGYVVGATWQTNTGIMQSNGTLRPAMSWLMDFLGR